MTVDGLNGGMFLYLITQQSKHRTGVSVSAWFKPTSSVKYLMDVSDVIYCSMRGSRTTSEPGSSADFGKSAGRSCNFVQLFGTGEYLSAALGHVEGRVLEQIGVGY